MIRIGRWRRRKGIGVIGSSKETSPSLLPSLPLFHSPIPIAQKVWYMCSKISKQTKITKKKHRIEGILADVPCSEILRSDINENEGRIRSEEKAMSSYMYVCVQTEERRQGKEK